MSPIHLPCALPMAGVPQPHALAMERVAMAVRDQTVELYRHFLHGKPVVDSTRWKSVKQRDGVEVFVARERNPPTAFHAGITEGVAPSEILAASDWVPQIKLRLVGQTLGSVDDAMFGATTPTDLDKAKLSAALVDDYVDHRTLLDIRMPSADEPFTYTGLKWSVWSSSKPRDRTYIETAGFTTVTCNGKSHRLGFVVHHSVQLPQFPSLEAQGVTRAKVSSCTLFRQLAPGSVEVFATEAVSPGGDMPYKVTTTQATDALLGVAKFTEYALKKKLVWLQTARTRGGKTSPELAPLVRRASHDSIPGISRSRSSKCENCMRSLSALRSFTTCDVCGTQVCSRCITTQKLIYGEKVHSIRVVPTAVCKGCLSTAKSVANAQDLAGQHFDDALERSNHSVDSAQGQQRRPSYASTEMSSDYLPSPFASSMASVRSVGWMRGGKSRRPSYASTECSVSYDDLRSPFNGDRESTASSSCCSRVEEEVKDTAVVVRYNRTPSTDSGYSHPRPSPSPPPMSSQQHQMKLWQQMNELCMQAETTYRQTKQQAQAQAIYGHHHGER